MGDPRRIKKAYETPRKPWDRARLESEKEVRETYGLKSKSELWRMQTILRKKRQNARRLLALPLEQRLKRQRELLQSLERIGILKKEASLDDILGLRLEEIMERRLQTIVWRNGLANTPKQARQFIVHGHISVNGRKVTVPSYIVVPGEEKAIGFYKKALVFERGRKAKKGAEGGRRGREGEEAVEEREGIEEKFEGAKGGLEGKKIDGSAALKGLKKGEALGEKRGAVGAESNA